MKASEREGSGAIWDEFLPEANNQAPDNIQFQQQSRGICNREKISKISLSMLSLGSFTISGYLAFEEAKGGRNIGLLSLYALANGGSIPPIFHMLIKPEYRRKINELISAWTYEAFLALSQVYANVVPPKQMQLWTLPIIWGFGVLEAKDLSVLVSMRKEHLSLSTRTPNEETLLRMLGFSTRDQSLGAKLWMTTLVVTSVGLTALNFVFADKYQQSDDFAKIGVYQDLIAMFSGTVLGELTARFIDNLKDKKEEAHREALLSSKAPNNLKVLRVAKNIFVLLAPLAVGVLLATPTIPNTVPDYFSKLGVGSFYGASLFVARREFENPESQLHSISLLMEDAMHGLASTVSKVGFLAKKYLPSMAFFAGLTSFMTWAAVQDSLRDDYAIIVLLTTTMFSFFLTDLIARKFRPQKNNRLLNELNFRLLYANIALSIYFQYLTTKINIGNRCLETDSKSLYALSLITWFFWGLNVGNNRAVSIQPRIPSSIPITPPIASQQLAKTLMYNVLPPASYCPE